MEKSDDLSISSVKQAIGLMVFVAICFAAGALGAAATTSAISGWYTEIAKPSWNPPNWIFGPVWSTLYLMMAIAGWLVWRRKNISNVKLSLGLFVVQLVLNSLWSVVFFGMQQMGPAFGEILLLWTAIVLRCLNFWRISKPATALLLPYLAWVSFAAFLNFAIWRLNM